jgi:hypothetical protein
MDNTVGRELDRLHDSRLVRLAWSGDRLSLTFLRDDKSEVALEFFGVQKLRVDQLLEGNIVSEALLYNKGSYASLFQQVQETVELLVAGEALLPNSPGYSLSRKSVEKIMLSIESGEQQCFCLVPSYGCNLVCLHRTMEFG